MKRVVAAAAAAASMALVLGATLVAAQQMYGFNDPTQPQLGAGQLPQALQTIPSPPGVVGGGTLTPQPTATTGTPLGVPQPLAAYGGQLPMAPGGMSPQAILAAATQGGGGGSGSAGPCPVLTFAHAVNRDALVGAGHTVSWTAQTPVASSSAVMAGGGAAASWTVMFVDVHFRINAGPEVNIRMNPAAADTKSWVLPGLNLMEGDTVSYYFTYSVVINGQRTDCDSPKFTFTRAGGAGGAGTGAGTPQPLQLNPQLPSQPLPLQQFQPLGVGAGTPLPLTGGSSAGSAVCPAVNWQWQMLPAPNAPNTYALQFVAQSSTNPQHQLMGISAVDVHYVLGTAPFNVRMVQAGPNAWLANVALSADQAKAGATTQLTFYFTYTAVFASPGATGGTGGTGDVSRSITCDTAQQTLQASSGVFGTTTSAGTSSDGGTVTPSAAGGQQPLMGQPPAVFNPFSSGAAPTGGSVVPPGTPDFARGQPIATPDAIAQFLRDQQQQQQNPFSGALPGALQPAAAGNPPVPPLPAGAQPPGCPAIDLNQQVTPAPNADGSQGWTVTFFAIQPRAPGAVLQSVERVGITALAGTTAIATNVPMARINGLVWEWDLPATTMLKAGDTLRYTFNYTVLLSGTPVTCNSSQFAFSVAPMGGPQAPGGQVQGATTPMQLAQLQQQLAAATQAMMTGFDPMRSGPPAPNGVQPLQANLPTGGSTNPNIPQPPMPGPAGGVPTSITDRIAQGQFLPPNARSLEDMKRGTASEVCPAVAFTHKVEAVTPSSAPSAAGPAPAGGVRVVFVATGAVKAGATLEKLNFVDLHMQIPNSPEINMRMTQSADSPATWTAVLPIGSLPSGVTYYFTTCASIAGQRVDCDTPLVSLAGPINNPNAPAAPAAPSGVQPLQANPPAPPAGPNPYGGAGTGAQPQQPFFPQQPAQPLFGGNPPTLTPSGVGAGGGSPAAPPAMGVPCPAIQWSYSFVPPTAANGPYKLVFTPGRPLRPDATLSKVNYVDLHYTVNGATPSNVNMARVAAPAAAGAAAGAGETFVFEPLALKAGDTFHWYFTMSVQLSGSTSPVQCDSAVQAFVAGAGSGVAPLSQSPFGSVPTLGGSGGTAPLSTPPTGSPPLPTGAGAGGSGLPPAPPAPMAGAACPAVTYDRQIMPLGSGNYELRWIGNGAVNPSATLQAVNAVDAHYVVNAQPQVNVKMLRSTAAGPNAPLTFTLPLTLPPGSAFAVYFTYNALLSSSTTPVSCDSQVFAFTSA